MARVRTLWLTMLLPVALAASASLATGAGDARQVQELAGRWAGDGLVEWKNGRQQPYKCVVTYILSENGAQLKQTLRCANTDNHRIELATLLRVAGEQLTGTWEERLTSMRGAVSGKLTIDGYEALAHNEFFAAKFEIAMAGCEQSVRITPNRDIHQIKAVLRKC